MIAPPFLQAGQNNRLLTSSFFSWLLESADQNHGPLHALQWEYEAGRVSTSEILAVCAFATLATQQDPGLQEKVKLFRDSVEIPDDFIPFANSPKTNAGSKGSSAAQILSSPSPELASAVADSVVAYLLRRRTKRRRRLAGLQVVAFQHPVDRALMATIKSLPVVDTILTKFVGSQARNAEVALTGRGILVGPQGGLSPLYECFAEACEALDLRPTPRLFIEQGPIGTRSLGIDHPSVVVTSATLSFLTRDELLFALGHELGHIKAGHLRYHTVAETIRDSAELLADMTLGISKILEGAAITPVLSSWVRRSELTADRAGYLACQDREVALRTILKFAGYPPSLYRELHSRVIVEQAAQLQELLSSGLMNRFYKLSQLWTAMQPFPILRAYELLEWLKDGFPEELLEMSPAQLAQVQAWQTDDPVLAEFIHAVVRIVADWAVSRYGLSPKQCRRTLRQIVLEGQSARGTNLAFILQVGIILEKASSDSVIFTLVVLVNEGGKAVKVKIPIERSESWDDVPKQYRDGFIRSGQTTLEYSVYSA